MENKKVSRRDFFKFGALGLSAIALAKVANFSIFGNAMAADKCGKGPAGQKLLEFDGPQAKSLNFVADAATTKDAKFAKGSNCGNCSFYQDKKAADGWAPCTMVANKFVPNCGWCKVWQKKKA